MKMTNPSARMFESLELRRLLTATTIVTEPMIGDVPPEQGIGITVNEVGSFGSNWDDGSGDNLVARYNPNGPRDIADNGFRSVFESGIALGKNEFSQHWFLESLVEINPDSNTLSINLVDINEPTSSSVTSTFTLSDCDLQTKDCYEDPIELAAANVVMTQEVEPVNDANDMRVGSLLTQTLTFTNVSDASIPVDVIRYVDAHAAYYQDSPYGHGGGRIGSGDLFEIDRASGNVEVAFEALLLSDSATISGDSYGVASYSELGISLLGAQMNNQVTGDGSDEDQMIDSNVDDLDPTMWMRNNFTIPVGGTVDYQTQLYFGTDLAGAPSVDNVQVNNSGNEIEIVFDDEVDVQLSDLQLFNVTGAPITANSFEYDILSSTATWKYGSDFNPHHLVLSDGVTDLSANALLGGDFEYVIGDIGGDGIINATDVDAVCAAIRSGNSSSEFDLNGDGTVNEEDLTFLIEDVLNTRKGDTDLDGDVDFADFLILSNRFGNSGGWADGDFDCSGDVAFADFLELSENFGYKR